ncbi:MAG: isochorismatase family cysteine hydrolase [Bacillota bacterium]|nr:isochorismatase family cysteine hydrolase [Bacillota bacterium]
MENINKKEFLDKSRVILEGVLDLLAGLPELKLSNMGSKNTALVIVDMINGFARTGALKSPAVEALIPGIERLSKACDKEGIIKVAFADNHTDASPEFESYPQHCITCTIESEIVDELKSVGGYTLIPKNSTNGFIEEGFQEWLKNNNDIDTFVVTGDCTDICVQQFAITLKTWFNKLDKKIRVIVPIELVDTYDLGLHNGELMNVIAFYNMIGNGIEVVKSIVIE